jgi:hypothetical protein
MKTADGFKVFSRGRRRAAIASAVAVCCGASTLLAGNVLSNVRTVVTSDVQIQVARALTVAIGDQFQFVINDNGNVAFGGFLSGKPYVFQERN